jgi:hypothetical protein
MYYVLMESLKNGQKQLLKWILCIQIKETVIVFSHNCLIIIVEIGRIELPTL